MNGNEFLDKISLVKPEYIEEAETAKRLTKNQLYRLVLPFAACIIFVFCFGVLIRTDGQLPGELPGEDISEPSVPIEPELPGSDYVNIVGNLIAERTEKFYNPEVQTGGNANSAVAWPWKLRTEFEQYDGLDFNGAHYSSNHSEIGEYLIGECLGEFEALGYDDINDEEHSKSVAVYSIRELDSSVAVAAKLAEGYYIFKPEEYLRPKNLGEFMEKYNLAVYMPLDSFSEWKGGEHQGNYGLEDYSFVWWVLESCADAEFVEMPEFDRSERNYLSFSADSEALGINHMALYVTEDGYIRTNAFSWEYNSFTFFIGEDAAGKIIDFALENKTEVPEIEPFYGEALFGTVTEIGEDYFLVSDEIMCIDPADAMVFKVPMNDLRISRYFSDYYGLGVGSTVRVNFTGGVDIARENLLMDVYDLAWVEIGIGIFDEEAETNPS